MKIRYDAHFLKEAQRFPKKTQVKLADLLAVLEQDPKSPLLHTKALSGKLVGLFSFRITRDWRVIFRFVDHDTIFLLAAKHRKDIYQEK
jgi:addiction module RelE/StbE family toxin